MDFVDLKYILVFRGPVHPGGSAFINKSFCGGFQRDTYSAVLRNTHEILNLPWAMAEHLLQRLIAKEPKTVPFPFDESTRSIKVILETLQNLLIYQGHKNVIANVNQYKNAMDKKRNFSKNSYSYPFFLKSHFDKFKRLQKNSNSGRI